MKLLPFAVAVAFTQIAALSLLAQTPSIRYTYATEEIIYSNYLNEERKIAIYTPPSYKNSNKPYPVVFVTDGQKHIFHMSGIMQFLAQKELMPESILVAIPHRNRNSDLLPESPIGSRVTGNADHFLSFIENELIPYIDNNYKTHPFKVIAGHSFGGLFTNYALLKKSNTFNGFISADPSLWWDNHWLEQRTRELIQSEPNFDRSYYFDQSEIQTMGGIEFSAMLESNAPKSFRWKFLHMPDETHESIVHKSFYNGLKFIFQDWPYDQVVFSPEGGLVAEDSTISLNMRHPSGETIHYTMDGSIPNESSPVYIDPITITQPGIIRASVVMSNNRISLPSKSIFKEAVLFPSLPALENLRQGLYFKYFTGDWDKLPDFDLITPIDTGIMSMPSIATWANDDHFALLIDGYIEIAENGIYTFYLNSDDGSRLTVDGVEIINNDGIHPAKNIEGYALLATGMHKIQIEYFERTGNSTFNLLYSTPSSSYSRTIPSTMWYHTPTH